MKDRITGLTDMHTHIVCGIDDGAANLRAMKKMLEMAYQVGIRHIISTPHFMPGRRKFDEATYQKSFALGQQYMEQIADVFDLYQGNEIYFHEQALPELQNGHIHTLADGPYILVEFNPQREFLYIRQSLRLLQERGYRVILAHAERMKHLNQIERIEELVERGIYIQVNADSIMGKNGHTLKQLSRQMLRESLVHFVASDCHDTTKRPPMLSACYRKIAKRYGEHMAHALMRLNPQAILEGKPL